ncbi:MAG: hypothetical protein MK211_05200 [Flavobacteriales bacterium]|jgi:hypothetical protein|nr:hypothetical protein [Flavobacteriales bacterium]
MKLEYLFFIPVILELMAAVTATVLYDKYKDAPEKYFLYFLWYTFLVEVIGAILKRYFEVENYWLYNAYMITSFLFYFSWYYAILKNLIFKRTVIVFSILFMIVALLSVIFEDWAEYHSYTFAMGALFVLVLTVFHFYQLLYSDVVLNIKYHLGFWISIALLLFYMGMLPLMFLSEFLDIEGVSYLIILLILNAILYGCYITGFLWTKKKHNYS